MRLGDWLQTISGLPTALGVCVGTVFGGLLLSSLPAAIPSLQAGTEGGSGDGLLTVAEVIGGVAGVLLAVLIFGVQFHAERLGEAAFLVRYTMLRQGLLPLSGAVFGVIVCNLVVGLVDGPWAAGNYIGARLVSVAGALIAVLAVLWLLYTNSQSLSGDVVVDTAKWGLLRDCEELLVGQLHAKECQAALDKHLKDIGAAPTKDDNVARWVGRVLSIRPTRDDIVADVNLSAVASLLEDVSSSVPGVRATAEFSIGERASESGGILIRVGGEPGAVPNVSPAARQRWQQQLERALVYRAETLTHRSLPWHLRWQSFRAGVCWGAMKPVNLFSFASFYEVLRSSATCLDLPTYTRLLRLARELVVEAARRSPSSLDSEDRERDVLSLEATIIDHSTLAESALRTGDQSKVESLLAWSTDVTFDGFHLNVREVRHAGMLTTHSLYRLSVGEDKMCDVVASRIDDHLYDLTYVVPERRLHAASGGAHREGVEDPGRLFDYLNFHLELIKLAVEYGRGEDAAKFAQRLFDEETYFLARRQHNAEVFGDVAPDVVYDLFVYSAILLAGCCVKLVRSGAECGDAIRSVLDAAVQAVGDQETVLHVWELTTHDEWHQRLGVRHWEMESEEDRVGVPRAGHVSQDWRLAGFALVGLLARQGGDLGSRSPQRSRRTAIEWEELRTCSEQMLSCEAIRSCFAAEDQRRAERWIERLNEGEFQSREHELR